MGIKLHKSNVLTVTFTNGYATLTKEDLDNVDWSKNKAIVNGISTEPNRTCLWGYTFTSTEFIALYCPFYSGQSTVTFTLQVFGSIY